ncbi:flagellar hook-length control protein FliK [Halopseudomonas sp. Lyrl_26]|uniref:flagellar hook-length control protein FliK n=1 Tax=Halopseudomonas sp. Lyrl_26 TaxID=3110923 RepID=UPI003F7ED263
MSTSQALMAIFSSDLRLAQGSSSPQKSTVGEGGELFAGLLAEQLPEELESLVGNLSADQLAALEEASLAVDGKVLPSELQQLIEQLPQQDGEPVSGEALAVISQWMQLLQPGAVPGTATPGGEPGSAAQPVTRMPGINSQGQLPVTNPEAGMLDADAGTPGGRADGAAQLTDTVRSSTTKMSTAPSVATASPAGQSATVQLPGQQDLAALQRTMGEAAPVTATQFSRLLEQMDPARTGLGEEGDALEGLGRSHAASSSAAAPLTARPVAAAMQPATVPFGHQSWGEAMVERVMWMSSQNLRSVEIQLDPAELGPLEIHIQNRGQELQVQFVSQNPGVREALEGQMHRLREMFAGQGLEQTQVTVADRSAGEQSRQGDGQLAERSGGQGGTGNSGRGDADTEQVAAATQRVERPLRGLVDYYV